MEFGELFCFGKKLGEGRFATTYMCTEVATGKRYACKCISKWKTITRAQIMQLKLEVEIQRALSVQKHPNIVSLVAVHEDALNTYLVMDLCEGGDLQQRIRAGALTEPHAAKVLHDVCNAMVQWHDAGIVHRDVKLENVLLQSEAGDSAAKVADFGLAQYCKASEELHDVAGSQWYMAPEVLKGHHGPKADVWSAGVLLYMALAQFPPFMALTVEDSYKTMKSGIPFDRAPWPSISEGAKDLLRNMLQFDVDKRFSAAQVLDHPWMKEKAPSHD